MAIIPPNAVSAYNAAVERMAEQSISESKPAGQNDFSTLVRNFAESAVETGKKSEILTAKAAVGEADINQVVIAVAEAEITLNTVVNVRDKVLQAYREILRMPR